MSDLRITNLHMHHGGFLAVKVINLDLPTGEFTVLVRPSGCGKLSGSRVQAGMFFGGATIIAALAAHDASRPGEKTVIDIDMFRAVIIDPTTDHVL